MSCSSEYSGQWFLKSILKRSFLCGFISSVTKIRQKHFRCTSSYSFAKLMPCGNLPWWAFFIAFLYNLNFGLFSCSYLLLQFFLTVCHCITKAEGETRIELHKISWKLSTKLFCDFTFFESDTQHIIMSYMEAVRIVCNQTTNWTLPQTWLWVFIYL